MRKRLLKFFFKKEFEEFEKEKEKAKNFKALRDKINKIEKDDGEIVKKINSQIKLGGKSGNYLVGLKEQEKQSFYADASTIYRNKVFNKVIDGLVGQQIHYAIRKSENWEEDLFRRGAISGMEIIKEEFIRLNSLHEAEGKEEKFNKNEVI